jgi:hypothetical protein
MVRVSRTRQPVSVVERTSSAGHPRKKKRGSAQNVLKSMDISLTPERRYVRRCSDVR